MSSPNQQPHRNGNGRRVAIFGAGPAGMSAAHELVERGFDVAIYERHSVLGGKTRSWSVPNTGTDGRKGLPADFGPHAMVGGYRNMVETLARIPAGNGATVIDSFQPASFEFGYSGRRTQIPFGDVAVMLDNISPEVCTAATLTGALAGIAGSFSKSLGHKVTPSDAAIMFTKAMALLTSGTKRQWGQLEHMTMADFMRTELMSDGIMEVLIMGMTIAAPPETINARVSIAALMCYLGSMINKGDGPTAPIVRMPTGPFDEIWWEPWRDHLVGLGTKIHTDTTLTQLSCVNGRITGATVRGAAGREENVDADYYLLAVPVDKVPALLNDDILAADPGLSRIKDLGTTWLGADSIFLNREIELPVFGACVSPWSIGFANPSPNFWQRDFAREYGDGTVHGVLSIDIGRYDRPGILYGKPANQCNPQERIDEIRAQVREHFGDSTLLSDTDIHSVTFSPALSMKNGSVVHDEPLYAPIPGCWANQPDVQTGIPNLLLASAYVRCNTGIDSTEAANEAAKRAVNAILAAVGDSADPAPVGDVAAPGNLELAWQVDDGRYDEGLPPSFDFFAPNVLNANIPAAVG